jgi:glucose-6-phosphate isomerase
LGRKVNRALLMADLDAAWRRLEADAQAARSRRIRRLFDEEPGRLAAMSLDGAGLFLDLSKQPWSREGFDAAMALARAADVETARERMFAGEAINRSEDRAVMHVALRAPEGARFSAKGEKVSGEVEAGRARMRDFAGKVRSGEIKGSGGAPITAVVHIGIGGSDLGPRMVWQALRPLDARIELRFAANVDGSAIAAALHGLDPAATLVVTVSKTFTTLETMANAQAAREWLRKGLGAKGDEHLLAVSANVAAAGAFGIAPERVFGFWDWVGGRYSVWSAVGLSCAIALGWDDFQGFLDGAAAMDAHFREAPLERNAPAALALAHIFNRNGLGRASRAVIPYAERLQLLPAFLQQLEMESNGKRVRADGRPVERSTAAAVFGEPGTNSQHAFFQQLHQGTDVIPVDFIAPALNHEGPPGSHAKLMANCLAQAEALMVGRSESEVRAELSGKGLAAAAIDELAPQRTFPGDRPSSLILMERLTPRALGALVALYEHKTFVEGTIWGIDSFDQWGVELGKTLASRILPELQAGAPGRHDPSTAALIARLKG